CGFVIVTARIKKLLKRLIATPMSRLQYLLSFLCSRLVFLILEIITLLGFGNTRREQRKESRYCTRDMGVANSRLRSFLLRAVTIANPSPQMLEPMRFMPSNPGIRKSM